MALTVTMSMAAPRWRAARSTLRPMRPKPLMPTRPPTPSLRSPTAGRAAYQGRVARRRPASGAGNDSGGPKAPRGTATHASLGLSLGRLGLGSEERRTLGHKPAED